MIKNLSTGLLCLFLLASLSGCVTRSTGYQQIPAAYLIECPLPPLPMTNGQLSEAFVQAYDCAARGNEDKAAIKALAPDP